MASPEEEGRDLARRFRAERGLGQGPIPDMIDVLAEAGLDVVVMDVPEGSGEDGLTMHDPELGVTVVAVATSTVSGRQRFTLAHELAHYLRGEHLSGADVHQRQSRDETVAHAFARNLLLPLESVVGLWATGVEPSILLNDLVRHFDVSPKVALIQMQHAGVRGADIGSLQQLTVRNLAATGGWIDLAVQRADMAKRPQGPRNLLRRLATAHKDGFVPIAELSDWSGVPPQEMEDALMPGAGGDE